MIRVARAGLSAAVAALLCLGGAPALAQTFPPDEAFSPLPCRDGLMTDLYQDEAGATGERDIVGDPEAPAGLRALDSEFLYIRLRLDADPAPNQNVRPFAWGIEFDLDGDRSTYEVLTIVDGVGKSVVLYQNTVTTIPNDPTDPADAPAVATYPFETHGRSASAAGSQYGDDADFFLDMAIPWDDLESIGLSPVSTVVAWAASSSNANSLNGDFACHDGATGDPTLEETAPDPTVVDPDTDSDGDGWTDGGELDHGTDPYDPNSHPDSEPDARLLEGGGGCQTSSAGEGAGLGGLLLVLALVAPVLRRRRRPH